MNKFKKFAEENHALITVVGVTILCFLLNPLLPNFIGLEGMIMLMVGFMSIGGIIGFLGKTNFKNRMVFISSLVVCVGIFFHLKYIPVEQRQIDNDFTIEETNEFYLLKVEGYKLLKLEKDEIKFDEQHPLKLYEFYKTDIFGYELIPDLQIKSDLMENYADPKIL